MTRHRVIAFALAATLIAAGSSGGGSSVDAKSKTDRPDRVENHYLVELKRGVDPVKYASSIASDHGGKVTITYNEVLGGFAFEGPPTAAKRLAGDPRVARVEPDRVVRVADDFPPNVRHLSRDRVPEAHVAGYRGQGITIAVLDTGVDSDHPVFREHDNILPGHGRCGGGGSSEDRSGHGTATASNAVGTIGVAHEAKVVPVKVFPRRSLATTWSRVLCGLNYVREHHAEIDVVNMSIAGRGSRAVRKAIRQLISSGVVVVAAAGNNGGRTLAPARYPGVISVSALAGGDRIARFSAKGQITAPGVNIYSADKRGRFSRRSGTSRSSPQVAGAAAIILALDPAASVFDVLRTSGRCPGGGTNGSAGACAGRWTGDDATAEPAVDAYCAAVLVDPAGTDPTACGF